MSRALEAGFSAAELLITLFIGVAFITASYQLYSIVIRDSAEARLRSTANNIAYHNLRLHTGKVGASCAVPTPSTTTTALSNDYLPSDSTLTVTISCPYGTSSTITKVETTVTYDSEKVTHATYAVQNS